ncbi:hypothetical protein O181_075330 [Austropuccinia psidii MF-1]|uniref:Uncharacterized protein n=1 Tax=Austropuccinia psidii MF-1 TaxID=1389203 RepID=A0A9Q3IDY0_9BASI|nr:hypothetical protein [Austropuccinia psidii MF-1]
MAMARGYLHLGLLSPFLVTHGIQMPNLPCKQIVWQLTPGLSGTQWLEDLFQQPSQPNEPHIQGLSQPSEPYENALTHEPEHELAPTQSMEEPFGKSPLHVFYYSQLFLTPPYPTPARPATPSSVIIINNMPIRFPLPLLLSRRSQPPPPLIPTMRHGRNLWTCYQHL